MKEKYALSWGDFSRYRPELYGFSALWICIFHSYLVGVYFFTDIPGARVIGKIIQRGNMGVDMFLFLSGLSLYFSYNNCSDLRIYLKKRFFRIWIPVLLTDGIYWLWELTATSNPGVFVMKISTLDFWITGRQRIWFVSFILLCYLIYPYLYQYFFYNENGMGRRLLILLAVIIVLNVSLSYAAPDFYDKHEIALTRLPVFVIGSFCGKLCREQRPISRGAAVLCLFLTIFSIVVYQDTPDWLSGMYLRYSYLICIAWMVVLVWLLQSVRPGIFNRILSWFGGISLELYLTSILFLNIYKNCAWYAEGNHLRYWIVVMCSVAASLPVHLIARRLQKLLHI